MSGELLCGRGSDGTTRGRSRRADARPAPAAAVRSGERGQRHPHVETQLAQLVAQVVVEEPARPEDSGGIDQEADVEVVGSGGEGREEVVRRQVERHDPGFDPVGGCQFVGQPEVAAGVAEREGFVVQAEQREDRRVQVVDVDLVLGRVPAGNRRSERPRRGRRIAGTRRTGCCGSPAGTPRGGRSKRSSRFLTWVSVGPASRETRRVF